MANTENKKAENILIAAIVGLIMILGSIFAFNHFKKDKPEDAPPPPPNPNPNPPPMANDNFPLKQGSKGPNVKYLQGAINRLVQNSQLKITEDSVFGPSTYNSLIAGVGLTTWWDTKKIGTYPVTLDAFNSIMHRSNENRFMMDGKLYTRTSINNQP